MYICLVGLKSHLSSGDCFSVDDTLHDFLEMIDVHVLKSDKEVRLLLEYINREEYACHVREIKED